MAIQTINLAVPGGDTPRSANTKINANFSDQTHAANKIVGAGAEQIPQNKHLGTAATKNVGAAKGQVPLAEDTYVAAFGGTVNTLIEAGAGISSDDFSAGTKNYVRKDVQGMPAPISSDESWYVETKFINAAAGKLHFQEAVNTKNARKLTRVSSSLNSYGTTWRRPTKDEETYATTTASGANVVVNTAGDLMRSTSSERYKDILAPLELDDARYADAMALKPIVYRSTADADNPAYHYYSFSAEELGSYDPAFTLWRETETVTDADGITTDQPLAERQAEGININALLAMSHAIAIKQGDLIKDLQAQVGHLQSEVAILQATNNP